MNSANNSPIIGIDLGTTYSSVAVYRHANAELIPNHIGKYSTPSIVTVTPTERKFGKNAQDHGMRKPLETLYDSKRMIGLPFAHPEIQKMKDKWPFTVIEENGKPVYSIDRGDHTDIFTPVEVSSMIVRYLKEEAEKFLGCTLTKAVITCPAYFTENQRQATIEAAELTGLHVERLLNEPTAAALAYGITVDHWDVHYLMVFDYGGGTLDISILHVEGNNFRVVAVHGDNHCGGRDIDNALTEYLAQEFQAQSKQDIHTNPRALAKLRSAAEDAKISLSSSQIATVDLTTLMNAFDFEYDITRSVFETLNEGTFQHCIALAQSALIDAGISADQLDKVLLVGGSSRIPRVQQLLEQAFPGKISHQIHPDEAVAKGAAVQASLLDPNSSHPDIMIVTDIIPYDLGVMVKDGSIPPIIYRRSPYGTTGTRRYQNAEENLSVAHINIYQVPLPMEGSPTRLGTVELEIAPGPIGSTTIDVAFEFNTNGILTVKATNTNTGVTRTKDINRNVSSHK